MERKNGNLKNTTIYQLREGVKADFEVMNQCLIIKLLEELDHHNAIPIREQSDKIISKKFIKDIIFDFSGTDFMDSSGIGVIMGRYKKALFIGGRVAVVGISDSVNRIFTLSGLYRIIKQYKDVKEALEVIESM